MNATKHQVSRFAGLRGTTLPSIVFACFVCASQLFSSDDAERSNRVWFLMTESPTLRVSLQATVEQSVQQCVPTRELYSLRRIRATQFKNRFPAT